MSGYVIVWTNNHFGVSSVVGNKKGKPFKTEKAAQKAVDKHYDHESTTKHDLFVVRQIQEGIA